MRYSKLAGRQIGIGEAETVIVDVNRAQVIRPFQFQQVEIADRSRADDLCDVTRNNFARLRLARLIADGHAPSGLDQLGNVTLGGMVRHAAHRHLVPLGQRHVEQRRRLLRVLKKQFVKITEPKEQQRIGRNTFPQPLILLHHRGERVLHHPRIKSPGRNCEFGIGPVQPVAAILRANRAAKTRAKSS